ncbi:MAG: MlaD family protein, partial [Actinomycetota bacterium]|nr:MlaD family protein [Actinomycetota bacterium]
MRRARVRLNLIVFGLLFLVLLFEASRSIITVGQIAHPYRLNAAFTNANGVLTHDEVDYLGVPYGEVSGVERAPGGVVIHLAITKNHRIPMGSIANLDLKSTIGEQYINFEPPPGYQGDHGPYYPTGFTLPATLDPAHPDHGYTTTPIQFSDLLRSADNLLSSIPPESLASLIHELQIGVNGTSDSLRTLIASGDQLSGALVTRSQALNKLIGDSTKLVHVVTDHRDSLSQSISDLRQVAAALQSIQPATSGLLDTASPLFAKAANLVAGAEGSLDCSLRGLGPIIDLLATPRKQQELAALFDFGPRAFGGFFDSRDVDNGPSGTNPSYSGVWLRVGLVVNSSHPAVQYNPPKPEPLPAAVTACTSALRPVSADYRPLNISARFAPLGLPVPVPGPAADGLTALGGGLMAWAYLRHRRLCRT